MAQGSVCYEMRDKGSCSRGKDCKYLHGKATLEEARKQQLKDKKAAQGDKSHQVAKGDSKGGKGYGKKGNDKGKGKEKSQPDPRKDKPCRFFRTAGGCSKGSRCPFSHSGNGEQKNSTGPVFWLTCRIWRESVQARRKARQWQRKIPFSAASIRPFWKIGRSEIRFWRPSLVLLGRRRRKLRERKRKPKESS